MYLVISDHAYDRLEQRVQGEVEIPEARILKLGRLVGLEEEFHVRDFLYSYVCKKDDCDAVVLLTVLVNVTSNPTMTKQNRRAEFQMRRQC
jgi:hypothetical protein